jgi:uncharacterized protein (TIGR02231 family)
MLPDALFQENPMRLALSGFFLATTCLVPALAADFAVSSHIDRVTVYPQGADVTRMADVTIPAGEHRIILADLPATIDPRSIRVEGEGSSPLEIASVDTKSQYIDQAARDAERKALEKQIAALYDERTALDQAISDANQQRTFLIGLSDRQIIPQASTETVKGIDVTQLAGLLDLMGTRLAALARGIQDAQLRQRAIDEQVNDLNAKLNAVAPANTYRMETVINVAAKAEMKGAIRVSYRLMEAGWSPYYDAKLVTSDTAPAKLEIVRRAEVTQYTSENWDNVSLVLSTTRPSGTTAAPELGEEELMVEEQRRNEVMRKQALEAPAASAPVMEMDGAMTVGEAASGNGGALGDKAKLDALKPVMQRQAVVELAGFQASFAITGLVSVDNTGQAKKVRISGDDHEATLVIESVPRLDPNAYLTASFKVKGQGPMLPGIANLYRDGVFVGQGGLPLLTEGEEATLGFGVDDLVKVERKEVKKSVGEEGILTSSNVEERAWDITVKNLHKGKMAVHILDRMPFSASEKIEVEVLAGMTAPTEKDYKKRRGVMSWSFDLEPAAETVVKTGYRITWPEGMRIGQAE